jgi:hypothetical protein
VQRVVHISALGIEGESTEYARTKLAAERQLLERSERGDLDGIVLRPSVVYGPDGESSRLFDALARLPRLPIPTMATTGLRTTCFSDTQLRLPSAVSSSSVTPWPLTDTLNVFFSPTLEKDSVSGETWTANVVGASTFAV